MKQDLLSAHPKLQKFTQFSLFFQTALAGTQTALCQLCQQNGWSLTLHSGLRGQGDGHDIRRGGQVDSQSAKTPCGECSSTNMDSRELKDVTENEQDSIIYILVGFSLRLWVSDFNPGKQKHDRAFITTQKPGLTGDFWWNPHLRSTESQARRRLSACYSSCRQTPNAVSVQNV